MRRMYRYRTYLHLEQQIRIFFCYQPDNKFNSLYKTLKQNLYKKCLHNFLLHLLTLFCADPAKYNSDLDPEHCLNLKISFYSALKPTVPCCTVLSYCICDENAFVASVTALIVISNIRNLRKLWQKIHESFI